MKVVENRRERLRALWSLAKAWGSDDKTVLTGAIIALNSELDGYVRIDISVSVYVPVEEYYLSIEEPKRG